MPTTKKRMTIRLKKYAEMQMNQIMQEHRYTANDAVNWALSNVNDYREKFVEAMKLLFPDVEDYHTAYMKLHDVRSAERKKWMAEIDAKLAERRRLMENPDCA